MSLDVLKTLSEPLTLLCGAVLPNRLAKAAMTERLSDSANRATGRHERLYRMWSEGGAGLLLTGNVQVDRKHLEAAGNVAIDGTENTDAIAALRRFAAAARVNGNHAWMQISHAGRQTLKALNPHPKAPSAITVALPGGQFGQPVALTADEIPPLIARFAHAARVARETGFSGVQIHGAHGYLISEFLSPKTNLRNDECRAPDPRRGRQRFPGFGKAQLRGFPARRISVRG
jgi:2,4-dienoyl-CoA reductase-like NADH-dependent reductase (Old Yellow Enzyme family)